MKVTGVTPYHAKYLAAVIRRKFPQSSVDRLIPIIYDADIGIHPHQIATANKILNSPVSSGYILSDQLGMGKSIEAAIIISWLWHKGEKKILVIAPVSQVEMWRKLLKVNFGLPTEIMTDENIATLKNDKKKEPLDIGRVLICTYKFAYEHESLIQNNKWDFVVVDEAHRLKDIYDIKSAIGDSIRASTLPHKKLLLTSTPFQSTMKRLFRIANMVDKYIFGDQRSYNYQFVSITDDINYKDLGKRLESVMSRTEAKRVPDFIGKARKSEILVQYEGNDIERDYITAMNNYFIDSSKFGLPSEKASLQSLALYKQVTLSPKIAMGGLGIIDQGLEILRKGEDQSDFLIEKFSEDIETLPWIKNEWFRSTQEVLDIKDFKSIQKDVEEEKKRLLLLREYVLAVKKDSRLNAFMAGLNKSEELIRSIKGKKRILVYTESLQAQKYLVFMLRDARKKGVYYINATNKDEESEKIYKAFIRNKKNRFLITGIEEIDRRTAIIQEFEAKGRILVATDRGLADQTLKHTYVVINYDLPVDPYITQLRISKIHGHLNPNDIIIVNIVSKDNEFEVWNYEKQRDTFDLFTGEYGRSDIPVGAIGVGSDFGMLIFGYYMKHHTIHLVERAFRKIAIQIKEAKSTSMRNYYSKLLLESARREQEHWDEVMKEFKPKLDLLLQGVLHVSAIMTQGYGKISARGAGTLRLTKKPFRMSDEDLGDYTFDLNEKPNRRKFYINSEFGGKMIDKALKQKLTIHHLKFSYRSVKPRKRSLTPLKGKSGVLDLRLVNVQGMQEEEHLIFTGLTDDGVMLEQEQCRDLMELSANDLGAVRVSGDYKKLIKPNIAELIDLLAERDEIYIQDFANKLEVWINDRIIVHKKDLRIIMTQRRKLHRRWVNATSTRKKEALDGELLEVGVFRRKKRRYIRKIIKYSSLEKDALVNKFRRETKYKYTSKSLFTIRWTLS